MDAHRLAQHVWEVTLLARCRAQAATSSCHFELPLRVELSHSAAAEAMKSVLSLCQDWE